MHAGKVFPGAIGIFSSANRCKIWHRVVRQFDRGGSKKEIVQYMNNFGNFKFILNDPFNCRRELVKKEGGQPETKGKDHIEEIKLFPFHTQAFPIGGVDGNVAKC